MTIQNKIKSLFKKPQHPKQPYIYAVTAGKYLGELLVYIEGNADDYSFLALPEMKIRHIPREKFDIGIRDKIIDVVEKLPAFVHKTCIQQFNKNKSSTLALEDTED